MTPTDNTVQPYSASLVCPMCMNGSSSVQFWAASLPGNPLQTDVLVITCNTCQYAYYMQTKKQAGL